MSQVNFDIGQEGMGIDLRKRGMITKDEIEYFEIGNNRRVSAQIFNNVLKIHIREYVKDVPTKFFGIGLTVDEWKLMISQIAKIDATVNKKQKGLQAVQLVKLSEPVENNHVLYKDIKIHDETCFKKKKTSQGHIDKFNYPRRMHYI